MITEKVSVFRRILPQVIATSVESIHHIDMGLSGAMPTILIANLSGIVNESNSNETLSMTGAQASWLAAIGFLILPIGSFASGFFADYFGRRRCLQLVNIPFVIGWGILYQTSEIWHIFASAVILTLGASLIKTTMVTYVGEICEPSIRTILVAFLNQSISFGMFIAFILNTMMPWRRIALVGLATPLISAVTLFLIPESPHFLLSKNRTKEAEKSLCWLRGWVSNDKIEHEFKALQRHSEHFKACNSCFKQNLQCSHPPPTLTEKLSDLKRRRTIKPFMILLPLFLITQFTGMQSMCPFIIQIFRAYESPISPDKAAIFMTTIDNIAHILFIFVVRITGKRRLFLAMGFGVFVSLLIISCYGFIYLPNGYVSFKQENQTFRLANKSLTWIPTLCLMTLGFCSKFGFLAMPFMLLSELFPFRSRSAAIGVAICINFVLGFISKKTYYNLETTLSMAGVSLLYCVICGIGVILMYFILPETEGLTLEDIEEHFSDNTKKITDWKIAKAEKVQDDSKEQHI